MTGLILDHGSNTPHNWVKFTRQSAELRLLNEAYPGIEFVSLRVWDYMRKDPWLDRQPISVDLNGVAATLIAAGFMVPAWRDVARCGRRQHRTPGFGKACVQQKADGTYALRCLLLDHALDLLAPVLSPLHWTPPAVRT